MHSRIVQLYKEELFEISEESLLESGFCPWIADYVSEIEGIDYVSEKKDFLAYMKGLGAQTNDDGIILPTGFAVDFFTKLLEEFKKHSNFTVEDCLGLNRAKYICQEFFGDPFGLYIADNTGCLHTFVDWLSIATEGAVYKIGKIIDYHY